jgi:PAS domain S-box-containing protein
VSIASGEAVASIGSICSIASIGWVEALLALLVVGSAGLAARWLRHSDASPTAYWLAGWVAGGSSAVLLELREAYPWLHVLSYPLGTLFPVLLLAGALALAARPVPRWLLAGAVAFGLLRAGLAARGRSDLAYGVALAVEPLVVLVAAGLVRRAVPRAGAARSERLLAPSFVVLAAIGAIHLVWLMRSQDVPPGLLALWVAAVPSLLGVQIHAEWERMRRTLQGARDELEERVRRRTSELARANVSLEREVAERRAAEEALRESEERHRVISELGSDLAFGFRVDLADRIHGGWVSEAFSRITGYALEDLAPAGWQELLHPDSIESCRRQFAEIVAGRTRELEAQLLTRDGRALDVRARIDLARDPRDGSLRVVGAARDVTEARRAEEERHRLELRLLEGQRLESLAMLTGGIAHDFNNLLAVILGNARIALGETEPDSRLRGRLSRIRAAAEHGARLTEQMLAYSGRSPIAPKPIELSRLVDEMADLLHASISERCELALELGERAPVEGDATQLRQVVLNLVTNASEALIGGSGSVRLRTGLVELGAGELAEAVGAADPPAGTYAFVEVSDDGRGMDAATCARIFEPFFTTKFSGRGLGLAAVLGIVRAHGGVLDVRSEIGRGTAIRVLVPSLRQGAGVARAESGRAPAAAGRRTGTILVVDDQDSVLELAQTFLERAGHAVIIAAGGRDAVERFRERAGEIDAVVLDMAMPDASGAEVLRELRHLRADVRVVIATGYGDATAAQRSVVQDVTGVIRKPYEPEELLELVDRALAERGARL